MPTFDSLGIPRTDCVDSSTRRTAGCEPHVRWCDRDSWRQLTYSPFLLCLGFLNVAGHILTVVQKGSAPGDWSCDAGPINAPIAFGGSYQATAAGGSGTVTLIALNTAAGP